MTDDNAINNYCLPIVCASVKDIEVTIEENVNTFQYFEIWVDYLDTFEPDKIAKLVSLYPGRLIIVLRRKLLAPVQLSFDQHAYLLEHLAGLDMYLDLDIFDQKKQLQNLSLKTAHNALICSYHNYERTPTQAELDDIIASMEVFKPLIYKMSCQCPNEAASLQLLETLLALRSQHKRFIVLGMGKYGLATRIFGPAWGNELNFLVSKIDDASAPGQLTVDQFKSISKLIGA